MKGVPRVWLPERLFVEMKKEGARMHPKETGGVLMGYQQEGDVVVTAVIGPGPNATHCRFSFIPDYNFQEEEIARAYKESGRVCVYLGDWHTHPDGSDRLSHADRKTLKAISNFQAARMNKPLMVILWGRAGSWSITAWRGRKAFNGLRFKIDPVEIVECA